MAYLDLSHPLSAETPVYPGDPKPVIEAVGSYEQLGYVDHVVRMDMHLGTHIDAPSHMVPGGANLGAYALERLIGSAVCIDVRNGFSLEAVQAASLGNAKTVLFCTGASARFHEESYWHDYSVMNLEIVDYLNSQGVTMVGVDTGSADVAEDFPIHKALLSMDMLILENLTGLEPLIGKQFELTVLPLNVDLEGAPARVVAKLL